MASNTFIQDYLIAECFGEAAIKDTYRRCKEWLGDPEMWGGLVVALNHLGWYHYDKNDQRLSELYFDLYQEAYDEGWKEYEGDKEKCRIYFEVTD